MTPKEHMEITVRLLEKRKQAKKLKGDKLAESFTIEQSIKHNKQRNSTRNKGWRKNVY